MVVTVAPSFIIASVRHELMRFPSTRTVHAPHWPWSQPFFVPVRLSRSRRTSSKVVQGATFKVASSPLTYRVIELVRGNSAAARVGVAAGGLVCIGRRRRVAVVPASRSDLRRAHGLCHPEEHDDSLAAATRRERLAGVLIATVDVLPVVHHPDVARG